MSSPSVLQTRELDRWHEMHFLSIPAGGMAEREDWISLEVKTRPRLRSLKRTLLPLVSCFPPYYCSP